MFTWNLAQSDVVSEQSWSGDDESPQELSTTPTMNRWVATHDDSRSDRTSTNSSSCPSPCPHASTATTTRRKRKNSTCKSPGHRPPSKRRTQDIESLREELVNLQQVLSKLQQSHWHKEQQLQSKAHHDAEASQQLQIWRHAAKHQSALSKESLEENQKLKTTLMEYRRMVDVLTKGVDETDRIARSLGTVEELEWKIGVLSLHPERRKLNADRIMNQFFSEIPSRAIVSGLAGLFTPTSYTRVENADTLDQVIRQEVVSMQFLHGSYKDLAALFHSFTRELIPMQAVSFVENTVIERFDENTVCRIARCLVNDANESDPKPRDDVPLKQMLMRRFVKDGCITFACKEARETSDPPSSMEVVDNVCGWFTLQDGGVDEHGQPMTIFKCNFQANMQPFSNRLESLLLVAKRLHLAEDLPNLVGMDYPGRKALEKRLRHLFMDYTMQVLLKIQLQRLEALNAHYKPCNANKRMQVEYLTGGCSPLANPSTSLRRNKRDEIQVPTRLPSLREQLARAKAHPLPTKPLGVPCE